MRAVDTPRMEVVFGGNGHCRDVARSRPQTRRTMAPALKRREQEREWTAVVDQPSDERRHHPPEEPSTTVAARAVNDAGPPRSRTQRRWPWLLALLLALVVAGGATAVAVQQRNVAAAWQEQTEALEEQRDGAIDRGDTVEAQLEELRAAFEVSEADVASLEARVRELADEKAQAEDTATTVQVERDVLADVSVRIADATTALDQCVSRLFDLQRASVDAFNRAAAGETVDVDPLNAQAQEVTDFCNSARSAAAAASSAAARLGGS